MRCLFLLLLAFPSFAQQKFKVDTLIHNGSTDNRINVVILGDGFKVEELPKFVTEARSFAESFKVYEPFKQYSRYLNFFCISTPSEESGISNPGTAPDAYHNHPVIQVNNFYGGSFGSGIHRLTGLSKDYLVYEVLAGNFPEYDVVVVILNTPFYGGSGGAYATFTLDYRANLIGIHEIGHSFGRLSDEYWAGSVYAYENINMTKETRREYVRWKDWLDTAPTGIFPHGTTPETAQWMKPTHANCLMELLDKPYCPVCREATVERIFNMVSPVDRAYPDVNSVIPLSEARDFGLNLVKPEPNTLQVAWELNGTPVEGTEKITIKPEDLSRGVSTLTATVVDKTLLSRKTPLRTTKITWKITGTVSEISIVPEKEVLCEGESVLLSVNGCTGSIAWGSGETTGIIRVSPSVSTSYTVQCHLPDGEILRDSLNLTVIQRPEVNAANTGPYFEKEVIKLQADGGRYYQWTGPLGFTSDLQNPEIPDARQANSGTYHVTSWHSPLCVSKASTEVKVELLLANEDPDVKVYPNPARDIVQIEVPFEGSTTVLLYTPEGKMLKHLVFEKSTAIQITHLASGLYFIKLQNGNREVVTKVTVL